jgi:hypothetical protein
LHGLTNTNCSFAPAFSISINNKEERKLKKLLILTLALSLTLLVAGSALAAVHNFTGDFSNPYLYPDYGYYDVAAFEGWYYIEKDNPSATVRGTFPAEQKSFDNAFGLEYFQNDQTFINLSFIKNDTSGIDLGYDRLNGSYLFDNNFFIGVDSWFHSSNSSTNLSPGYRFNLAQDAGYIAASLDYAVDKYIFNNEKGIIDYEIYGRYYTNNSRVYGQMVIANDDVLGYDSKYLMLGGVYKIFDNVVLGAIFKKYEDDPDYGSNYTCFEIGCTTAFNKLGAEFRYINCNYDDNSDYSALDCNILYSFTDKFRAGFEVEKCNYADEGDLDPSLLAKAKYRINDANEVLLSYCFKNDSEDADYAEAISYLRWDIKIK